MKQQMRSYVPTPRLVNAKIAAEYCGMSVATFKKECDVRPIAFGTNASLLRWDIHEIDAWIDRQKEDGYITFTDWVDRVGS